MPPARRDSAENVSRSGALLFTAVYWIFIGLILAYFHGRWLLDWHGRSGQKARRGEGCHEGKHGEYVAVLFGVGILTAVALARAVLAATLHGRDFPGDVPFNYAVGFLLT